MDARSVNLINNDKPVVVCCGDSITHGHIGYDWVSSLRNSDDSKIYINAGINACLLYTSPSPRDKTPSRMPSSA